jgi:arylsulfatase A-like enzyme
MDHRPNIIHILADDLGYADLGCTGARDVYNQAIDVSPNLDAMARQGMRFTHAYANSALCSPTRFALLTGRWQYRLRGAAEEPLGPTAHIFGVPPDHPTLPSLLKHSGYATALFGKWHLGAPPRFGPRLSGYGEFFGCHSGGLDYFAHTDVRGKHDLWENESPAQAEGYFTDMLSARAVDLIERQDTERTPFFMSVHYTAPHWPWLTRDDRVESQRTFNRGEHVDGGSVPIYQRMIHHMDEGIGQLLDALERKGFAENTLVIFTSDNGGERFSNNWPFMGQKMDLLEGGLRVPLIVRWPRAVAAGQLHATPNISMDWSATMMSAAGVPAEPDYPLDGVDLSPALSDPAWRRQGDLCWRMKHRDQRALVRGPWKYLRIDGIDYLFNIDADARERANLRERHPQRLQELKDAWQAWDRTMPPIPEDAQVYKLYTQEHMPQSTYG